MTYRKFIAAARRARKKGFTLKESCDFAGSSHEKITREEYTREK